MKINNYEISKNARFYIVVEDEIPVSVDAGNGIPNIAAWRNQKPKEYNLGKSFFVACDKKEFYDLVMADQAAS
jgi:hypothetical protein